MVLVILLFDSFCQLNSKIYFLGSVPACMILFYSYLWKSITGNMAEEITSMSREFFEQQLIPVPIKRVLLFPCLCLQGPCIILDLSYGIKQELAHKSLTMLFICLSLLSITYEYDNHNKILYKIIHCNPAIHYISINILCIPWRWKWCNSYRYLYVCHIWIEYICVYLCFSAEQWRLLSFGNML